MSARKNALGRGLGALLQDAVDTNAPVNDSHAAFPLIPIDEIQVNPYQPRTMFDEEALNELCESIKNQGLIQPITVRRLADGTFQLVSGERRLRASKMAGVKEIPAFVRDVDDSVMLELALVENIQRENLNAIEVALTFEKLIEECNITQDELSQKIGKKRSTVTNYLRLLKLPIEIQAGIRDEKITMGHARALVNIESLDLQLDIFHRILKEQLSVRQVEDIVRNSAQTKPVKNKPIGKSHPAAVHIREKLVSRLGVKISVKSGNDGEGSITIRYKNQEQLQQLADLFN